MMGKVAAMRRLFVTASLAAGIYCALAQLALAQTPSGKLFFAQTLEEADVAEPAPQAEPAKPAITDSNIAPARCVNCTTGGLISPYGSTASILGGCSSCGCAGQCIPGREQCPPCEQENGIDHCLCTLYNCICCPDHCYDPHWTPIADAAFFVDAARPQTQTRIRVDDGIGLIFPDRATYFWARADGMGKGPSTPELRVDYVTTSLYTEAATSKVSAFVEIPYQSIDPAFNPHAAGFGDMNIGTKTLLLDCDLVQVTLQFRTYLPVGNSHEGLGNGHVSLEPSLLFGLRISEDSFLQGQVSEWVPIAGDSGYEGAILHYHFSWNNVLYRFHPEVPLVGTLEANGWSFQTGSYTAPGVGESFQHAGDYTYASAGPGLRLFVCEKLDFGVGVATALTQEHFATTLYRIELRIRF